MGSPKRAGHSTDQDAFPALYRSCEMAQRRSAGPVVVAGRRRRCPSHRHSELVQDSRREAIGRERGHIDEDLSPAAIRCASREN
jgi:hypothetical protein